MSRVNKNRRTRRGKRANRSNRVISNNMGGETGNLRPVNATSPLRALGVPSVFHSYYGRNPAPIPGAIRTFLVVRGTFSNTTANPGLNTTSYKLNALVPSAGFEYGYADELCALYKRYRIVSSSLSCILRPDTNAHRIAVYPTTSSESPGTLFGAAERRFAKTAEARPGGNKDVAIVTSAVPCSLLAESANRDIDYTGAIAAGVPADPDKLMYWWVISQKTPAGDSTCNVDFKICAEVIFSEPIDSTSSDD